MKQLIWIIVLFAVGIGLALLSNIYTGNVFIQVNTLLVRVNLNLFIVGLLLGVLLLYILVGLFAALLGAPGRVSRFGTRRKCRKAAQALNAAGLAYFEGKYRQAEQQAAKVLANKEAGDNRVLALLLAAHAADQSGDREASLRYLADIAKLPEKQQLSRHLLLAESALSSQDYVSADNHLKAAAQTNPRLTRLVRLQLRLAQDQGDALEILDKTDKLVRAGAVSDTAARQYSLQAYRKLLQSADDAAGMKACLKRIPDALKEDELCQTVAERYAELGLYRQAVSWVGKYYPLNHQAGLLPPLIESVRYLSDKEQRKIIDTADAWLPHNPNDARLLMYLGELAYNKQLWGKAQGYLEASIGIAPSPSARLILAKVLDESGQSAEAENQRRLALEQMGDE